MTPGTASAVFDAVVEPLHQHEDLEEFSVGGFLVDMVVSVFAGLLAGPALSVSAPSVCVRIKDRATSDTVYELPCGKDQTLAEGVAASFRTEMETMTAERFLEEYGIHPERVWTAHWRAYVGIGSNLGDRLANLQGAVDGLQQRDGITVVWVSEVYETAPVGGPAQPDYLNAAVAVDTVLHARELLPIAQHLEAEAQRVRNERWGPRTLDVDLLIVGDEEIDEPDLTVPHPRMRERGFVLAPLAGFLPPGAVEAPEGGWPGVRLTDLSLRLP